MIYIHAPALLLAALFSLSGELRQYSTLQKANARYTRGEYARAEQLYRSLEDIAPGKALVASARFNLAGSLAMQGRHAEARRIYRSIVMNPAERELRNPSLYNEATSLAIEGISAKESSGRIRMLEQALLRYTSVLRSDPADTDARINYEIVFCLLQQQQPSSSGQQESRGQSLAPRGSNDMTAAERMLENAKTEENGVMQKIPQNHEHGHASGKKSRDW